MLRIVGGQWRGRRISAPAGSEVRPTSDRVREAWMSIVRAELQDAFVVDLCAGSGALGLEALSRGAARVEFVDQSARSIRTIEANIALLGAAEATRVIRADVLRYVAGLPSGAYDVAFADPPYRDDTAVRLVELWCATPFAPLLGIEHAASRPLPDGGDTRRYGDTALTIFRCP